MATYWKAQIYCITTPNVVPRPAALPSGIWELVRDAEFQVHQLLLN